MGFLGFFSSGGTKQESNTGFLPANKGYASDTAVNGLAGLFTSADDLYCNHAMPQFNMSSTIPACPRAGRGSQCLCE